jgi:hypothetical protein
MCYTPVCIGGKNNVKKLFVLLFACLAFLLGSCEESPDARGPEDPFTITFDRGEFERERQQWNARNQNYSYVMQYDSGNRHCYTVKDGIMTNREVLAGYGENPLVIGLPDGESAFAVTLSTLYDYLEQEINKIQQEFNAKSIDGAKLKITYNPVYHFPALWEFTKYKIEEYTTTTNESGGTDTYIKYGAQTTDTGRNSRILDFKPLD